MASLIIDLINSLLAPLLKGTFISHCLCEKRQGRILPSEVRRILLQLWQNGLLIAEINPISPRHPVILYRFAGPSEGEGEISFIFPNLANFF